MNRRRFLGGVLASLGIAGCLSRNRNADAARIGAVTIRNIDQTEHTVDFRVELNGNVVHNQTYELQPDDPGDNVSPVVVPERTWPQTPGEYTVSARLVGDDWKTITSAMVSSECLGLSIRITRAGGLETWASPSPYECSREVSVDEQNQQGRKE